MSIPFPFQPNQPLLQPQKKIDLNPPAPPVIKNSFQIDRPWQKPVPDTKIEDSIQSYLAGRVPTRKEELAFRDPAQERRGAPGGKNIVVFDSFNEKYIDLDGDTKPDVSHGELVSMQILGVLPDANLIRYNTDLALTDYVHHNTDFFHLDKVPADLTERLTAQGFRQLAKEIKGGLSIDGVNLSQSSDKSIQINILAAATGLKLDHKNIKEHRPAIRDMIKKWATTPDPKTLTPIQKDLAKSWQVIESIEQVTEKNIPVYIAAGNEGQDSLNLYSFAKGTTTVGALTARGGRTQYSANHAMVDKTDQGTFNVVPISQDGRVIGYDLTGDNKADISARSLSGQGNFINPDIAKFAGKKPKDVQISPQDLEQFKIAFQDFLKSKKEGKPTRFVELLPKNIHDVLIPMADYMMAVGASKENAEIAKEKKGDFMLFGGEAYRVDSQGKLFYTPDGSNQAAIWQIDGTSFSAPKALATMLKDKK